MLDAWFFTRQFKRTGASIWKRLPSRLQEQPPANSVNHWIHALSRKYSARRKSDPVRYPSTTRFLRYPLMLQTICDLVRDREFGDTIRLCVMACSTGAEPYSILWAVRKARPDLKILATGIDLSESSVAKAKAGRYSRQDQELKGVSEELLPELFDLSEATLKVKDSIAAGTEWIARDVCDDSLHAQLGLQDIVIANNFLVFMTEDQATACLRKVIQFVKPGGLLFCRGVDLDVRERAARQFDLEPISLRIEEIHDCNPRERHGWPWQYWGLEPLDKTRKDWVRRYATIFRTRGAAEYEKSPQNTEPPGAFVESLRSSR